MYVRTNGWEKITQADHFSFQEASCGASGQCHHFLPEAIIV